MWVRFLADMDFKPTAGTTIEYKAGMVENVTRACAEQAVRAGKGLRLRKVSKDSSPDISVQPVNERIVDGWAVVEKRGPPIFLRGPGNAEA